MADADPPPEQAKIVLPQFCPERHDRSGIGKSACCFDPQRKPFTRTRRLLPDEPGPQCPIIGDGDHNNTISPCPHVLAFNLQGDFLDGYGSWEQPDLEVRR